MMSVLFVVVAVLCGAIYSFKKSVLSPVLWENPNVLPTFGGFTSVNSILQHGFRVTSNFSGPESLAFDDETGDVFASLNDGSVGRFAENGEFVERIFFVGGFMAPQQVKQSDRLHQHDLLSWCKQEAESGRLSWNKGDEDRCGRPLGLRFRKIENEKFLFILDTRHGLFQLNLNTQVAVHVFDANTPIIPPPPADPSQPKVTVDPVALQPLLFFNDLDITADNRVIFSDSSYKNTRTENRQEVLDGAPRGRIMQFDLATNQMTPLVCGLHFPNGVQILNNMQPPSSPKQAHSGSGRALRDVEVLVAELARFRIVKINLSCTSVQSGAFLEDCGENGTFNQAILESSRAKKDPNFGTEDNNNNGAVTVFTDSLPGIPDNIRLDSTHLDKQGRGYYLVDIGSISVRPFSVLWTAYQSIWLRDFIGKFVPMKLVEQLVPRYGLVLVINSDGDIVNSMHDQGGSVVALLSHADIHPRTGDLWLGSHSEPYIGIVKKEFLPAAWE